MPSRSILVVDDDVDMACLMRDILKSSYNVILAHNGMEAIEKSKKEKVDLILLDIRMPFFSGFWFCDAFKQRPETKHIPIVMVSGLLDDESIRKAYDAGAAACLKKPFEPSELLELVEKILPK